MTDLLPNAPSTDLIARLEAATAGSRELDAEIGLLVGATRALLTPDEISIHDKHAMGFLPHYTTSLDMALSLVPQAPRGGGWFWRVGRGSERPGWAHLNKYDASNCDTKDEVTAYAATPALALVIACLKARSAP